MNDNCRECHGTGYVMLLETKAACKTCNYCEQIAVHPDVQAEASLPPFIVNVTLADLANIQDEVVKATSPFKIADAELTAIWIHPVAERVAQLEKKIDLLEGFVVELKGIVNFWRDRCLAAENAAKKEFATAESRAIGGIEPLTKVSISGPAVVRE